MGGPLDTSRFEGPGGEQRAFRHLYVPSDERLPLPRLVGKSVFAYVEDENANRGGVGPWYYCDGTQWIPLSGGGTGPWPWDYMVSAGWAAEVAAGRGSEGLAITAFGHTFRVYSTVMAAITDGIARFARSFTVFATPGTYAEQLDIPSFSHEIYIYGTGRDSTIIGGNTLSHRVGNTEVFFEHLTLTASGAEKALAQKAATINMNVHCRDVIFRRPMAGDHAGSQFYDCNFEQGWVPEAGDTPDTVTLVDCKTSQPFDFQASNISINQWHFIAFRLQGASAILKFYRLTNCFIEIIGGTGTAVQLAIDVSSSIRSTTIMGIFKSPGAGTAVMNFALLDAGLQHDGVKIIATFETNTGTTGTAARFIKTSGAGVARGWHIDATETRDGLGAFLEDRGAGSVSVEMANAQGCKFTLAPHDKMAVLVSAGSQNIVDSGVIATGSVGVAPAPGTVRVEEDNATVVATAQAIDFAEPDATLVTDGGSGEAEINMALYALLAGRAGGQMLIGGTGAGNGITLRSQSGVTNRDILIPDTGDILQLAGAAASAGLSLRRLDALGAPTASRAFLRMGENTDLGDGALDIGLTDGWNSGTIRFFPFSASNPHLLINDRSTEFHWAAGEVGNTGKVLFISQDPSGNPMIEFDSTGGLGFEHRLIFDLANDRWEFVQGTSLIVQTLLPVTDNARDLGSATLRWRDLYFTGTIRSASAPTSIQVGGSVTVGADAAANTSSSIDLQATNQAALLNRLTTTQRDALTPANGMVIYNTTDAKFQGYESGAWANLIGAAAAHDLLSATHGDTLAAAVSRGSLVVGNATPAWAELVAGAAGSILRSDGTDPAWTVNPAIAGYVRVGSAAAPANTTAGDLTAARLFVGNVALAAGNRLVQVSDTYTPGTGIFRTASISTTVTPGAGVSSDEQHGLRVEMFVQPTAIFAGASRGVSIEVEHDAGGFDVTLLQGLTVTVQEDNVGAVTLVGGRFRYRPTAGATVTAIGLLVERGRSADVGTLQTGVGLRIEASTGVTPATNDIAIQSQGGENRFVGGTTIGADAAPALGFLLDVRGNLKLGAFYTDIAQIAAPAAPAFGTRRLFVDSATGELSVRTDAGTTVSLEGGFATHIATFHPITESLAVGALWPTTGICVGESGEHGAFTAIRAKAVAGTAGTGTTTIVVEADDNPAFSTPTTLFTLALNAATEVDDTVLDNAWAAGDIFIRARCTAVGGTPPKEVVVEFFFKEQVEAF